MNYSQVPLGYVLMLIDGQINEEDLNNIINRGIPSLSGDAMMEVSYA